MSLLGGRTKLKGNNRPTDEPSQQDRLIDALNEVLAAKHQEIVRLKEHIAELERNDQAQMSEILRLRQLGQFRTMGDSQP